MFTISGINFFHGEGQKVWFVWWVLVASCHLVPLAHARLVSCQGLHACWDNMGGRVPCYDMFICWGCDCLVFEWLRFSRWYFRVVTISGINFFHGEGQKVIFCWWVFFASCHLVSSVHARLVSCQRLHFCYDNIGGRVPCYDLFICWGCDCLVFEWLRFSG